MHAAFPASWFSAVANKSVIPGGLQRLCGLHGHRRPLQHEPSLSSSSSSSSLSSPYTLLRSAQTDCSFTSRTKEHSGRQTTAISELYALILAKNLADKKKTGVPCTTQLLVDRINTPPICDRQTDRQTDRINQSNFICQIQFHK